MAACFRAIDGGLDMAVEAVTGATAAWFCEYDDAPAKILAHHYPSIPTHRDVTTINWSQVEPVDILTGGTPCQDLSHAGKRAGMSEGTRSNLWVNMREAIIHLNPQLVVWENVLGALSATATSDSDMEPGTGLLGDAGGGYLRALGRVLGDLAEIGYDATWTTVRASDVGAPHHRARVFLVAWPQVPDSENNGCERSGETREGWAGLTNGHNRTVEWGDYAPSVRYGGMKNGNPAESGPAEVLRDMRGGVLPQEVQRPIRGQNPIPGPKDMRTVMREQQEGSSGRFAQVEGATGSQANGMRDMPLDPESACAPQGQEPGEQCGGKPSHAVRELPSETSLGGGQGLPGIHNQECEWGPYTAAIRRWERVLGRPAPNPTEPNTKGKPRLSAVFSEYLMGLPAGWVTEVPELSRAQQLKAIGNGVCPQQAAAALTELIGSTL